MRASKRSRADRLSYLVATGHINKEELAQDSCLPLDNIENNTRINDNIIIINNINNHNTHRHHQLNSNQLPANSIMTTPMTTTTASSLSPQHAAFGADGAAFLDSSATSLTPDNFIINSNKIKKNLKVRMPTDNRGQFRRSRTEVTLPMKTSPAFEYILKDKGRRSRRCYLWLVYSALMTIGLTVIVLCSVQLMMRYQNSHS